MKRFLLLVFLSILFLSIHAQNYNFEPITTQQGLSQNDVNCIFQDHNGFLWIGTNDGLNRYDGYTFRTYRVNSDSKVGKGLSSNLIFKVKEDRNGRLWIATSNEGVCVFDVEKEEFTQIRNISENPVCLADNRVLDIACMSDGSVWVATISGVSIINEKDGKFVTTNLITIANSPLVSKACNLVVEDSKGRKWLGFYNGLVVCETDLSGVTTRAIGRFDGQNIRTVLSVDNGLIIGTGSGLYYLQEGHSPDDNQISKIINAPCRNAIVDKSKQTIYVGTHKGLMIYACDFKQNSFALKAQFEQNESSNSINNNMIMSIYEDNSGIIWIGTKGGGLNKYNPNRKKFNHYKSSDQEGSLSSNKVRAIAEDSKHNIWIGTENGGINFLDASEKRNFTAGFKNFTAGNAMVEGNVYSLLQASDDEIWVGASYQLYKFQLNKKKNGFAPEDLHWLNEIKESTFSMLKDLQNNIWIGTYGTSGLFKYTQVNNNYKLLNFRAKGVTGSLSSNIIRSLLLDKSGNIWIGTDAGLNVIPADELNKDNPEFKVFKNNPSDKNSLSNDYILPVFQATNGDIWVGTMGGGLNKIEHADKLDAVSFKRYGVAEGFPNEVIKGILEDENGCLWISSNKGLTKFDPATNAVMNFDISDGLQDYEFGELACCKLDDGLMIFGGINGINTFYPNQIKEDKAPSQVAFTDLQILNKSIKVGEEIHNRVILEKVINQTERIKLKYSENSFAIYFSALHFSAPLKNKYKYMLEGFDKNWIIKGADERFAKYTSLSPGTYVFKLYASNNDGIWNDTARELEIIVIPPWWRSNLAYVFYFLLFFVMLLFFQRYSFIRIKKKNDLLMEHFEKEKTEELTKMKFQFFTNISHEFRTPLTLIIGSVQKMQAEEDDLSPSLQERCRVISRNSSVMLRLINQLMDFRKMEQDKMVLSVSSGNIVAYLKDVYSSFKEVAADKNIEFTFSAPADELEVWMDTDKIEKIIYNLLSNAFKFTKNGGRVDMVVSSEADYVIVQVKDNGIGIPKEMQKRIFDRFYQATNLKQQSAVGTGIGLSLSKGLAELHHGDIRFNSEEGLGSCFELVLKKGKEHYKDTDFEKVQPKQVISVELPVMIEASVPDRTTPTSLDANSGIHKYSLLIVEDNVELLDFLSAVFGNHYNVYRAANGIEGLEIIEQQDINIVISDIAMPKKDGYELCKEIKTEERYSHIPVILLTAKTTPEDSIKGYQLGADAYVSKPFDINILEAQVAAVLANREELKLRFRKSVEIVPSEVTTTAADEKFLSRILTIVEENLSDNEFSVEKLAVLYGMPKINITKKIKSLTGENTRIFIRDVRLNRAYQLLRTGRYSVVEVMYEVGFLDVKHFRSSFKSKFNMNPSECFREE